MTHQQEVADRLAQLRREKSARERRDVLQREIAKAAGLSVVTYGRYESGQRKVPDEVVMSLAGYYGTTPWFIRYGVEAGAGSPVTGTLTQPELDQLRKERDAARRDAASSTTPEAALAPRKTRKVAGGRARSKRPPGAK